MTVDLTNRLVAFAKPCLSQAWRTIALLAFLLFGQTANADLIIASTNTGWYQDNGYHIPGNVNYGTGDIGFEFHNFFVFDLSGVVGTASSATLRAYLVSDTGFNSPDPTETWGLFDVTTNLSDLTAGTGGVSAYTDLGSGIAYGQAVVSAADMGSFVEVSLNADALAAIGSAGGLWAVGGRLLDLEYDGFPAEIVFGDSHKDPRVELVLNGVVATPNTTALVTLALTGLCWLRRSSGRRLVPPLRCSN